MLGKFARRTEENPTQKGGLSKEGHKSEMDFTGNCGQVRIMVISGRGFWKVGVTTNR